MGTQMRAVWTLLVIALIPVLMAMTILIPADAETQAVPERVGVTAPDSSYDVVVDTGTVVVMNASVISAISVTSETPADGDSTSEAD